jgi:hypothetical protein
MAPALPERLSPWTEKTSPTGTQLALESVRLRRCETGDASTEIFRSQPEPMEAPVKSKPLRSRKIARSTPLWFPKSLGAAKLKRVLYFMRYPRGRVIEPHAVRFSE